MQSSGLTHELNIPEEHFLFFQLLSINENNFKKNISIRIKNAKILSEIINDDEMLFYSLDESNNRIPLYRSNWELLGLYSHILKNTDKEEENDELVIDVKDEKMSYSWVWPWTIFQNERNIKLKEYLKELPKSLDNLSKDILYFQDPMVVSYLFAYLSYHMQLEYIYVHFDEEKYSAFGLKNIKWLKDPDEILIKEYNESAVKILDEEDKHKKGKPINWENIFKLYFSQKDQNKPQ